jgi:lysozyme family protein
MANVKEAIDRVLIEEDATLSAHVVNLHDGAGRTRLGITSVNHPELIPRGFFDEAKMNRIQAIAVAEQVYSDYYATPLHIADIQDQALANAVLSFGVNSGIATSAHTLQQACVECGEHLDVDGHLGPATIAAVNSLNAKWLLTEFSNLAQAYYKLIASIHPADEVFLRGWLARASKWSEAA